MKISFQQQQQQQIAIISAYNEGKSEVNGSIRQFGNYVN